MDKKATDVMIYTQAKLDDEQFSEITRQVRTIDGVTRFERSQHKPQFILVAYQASKTRALAILDKITRMGFNASLVGI
ncbi:MAG: hypothetical protein OEZ16_01805 [Chromatiales bacterium]|nr:hypothetical protein [Chromatiales bacterium]